MTQGHIQYERFQRSHWDDENKRHVTDADTYHPPPETHVRQAPEKQARMLLFLHLGLCIVSLCALSTSVLLHRKPTQVESAQRVSTYSPLWDVVEFWAGDFVNYFNHSSIYRGPPTLEREKAWDKLWNHTYIGVDSARLPELNRVDRGQFVPVIGSDPAHPTYAAQAEIFHQLHCLNLIRQYTWPLEKFDRSWGDVYPDALTDNPVAVRMHVDHCIETLRLALMCTSDVTPMLIERSPDRLLGHKFDFNPYHKCRNFDKIAEFVDEKDYDIIPPPGKNDL